MEGVRSLSPEISDSLTEAVVRRCSLKKVLLKILKNSQENTCARVSFFKVADLRPAALLKKRLWHRCFPVNFAKFLGTPFFIEHYFFGFYFIYGSKRSQTLLLTLLSITIIFIFNNALLKNDYLWKLVILLEASFFNVIVFIYSIMKVQERLPPCQYRYFVLYYVLYY